MAPQSYHSNPVELVRPTLQGVRSNWRSYVLTLLVLAGALFGLALVAGLIIGVLYAVAKTPGVIIGAIIAAILVFGVAISYLLLPYYRIILASAKHQPITLNEAMATNPSLSWKLFGTVILSTLAIIGGYILIIVPGLIFSAWFAYVPFVVIEEGLTGRKALGRSRELARGHVVETWSAMAVVQIAQIVTIVPVVGSLLSFIVGLVLAPLIAIRYLELAKLKASDTEAPKRSGWNWGVIAIAIVIIIGIGALSLARAQTGHTNSQVRLDNQYSTF